MDFTYPDLAFFYVSWAHVILAPYTKVEESFNLHATHDLLMYGPWPEQLRNVRLIVPFLAHMNIFKDYHSLIILLSLEWSPARLWAASCSPMSPTPYYG